MVRAHPMRKFLFLVVFAAVGYVGLTHYRQLSLGGGQLTGVNSANDGAIDRAQESMVSGGQLQGQGTVVKVLPDDNEGSRHQKFILQLPTGQTLLVAHNIDIASRISSLRVGDNVSFSGEYERNFNGGVIHWTHHDPRGRHAAGWLKHGGKTYQ